MLVFLEGSYFTKLWCNYELAVHVKTSNSKNGLQVVPIWMPLWTLSWFGAISLSACFTMLVGKESLKVPKLDLQSRISRALSYSYWIFPNSFLGLLVCVPMSWFCIQKVKSHKSMLDQMLHFDLRNARCTLETDRIVIEGQVLQFLVCVAIRFDYCLCHYVLFSHWMGLPDLFQI